MIFLQNLKQDGKVYFLVGEEYTVGRKDSAILISGDQSISRKHAVLRLVHPEGNLNNINNPPCLELKDSSKFGTVVNDRKVANGEAVTLSHGDNVSFGAQGTNSWRVHCEPLIAACSGISGAEKKDLKVLVHSLGGHLLSEWQTECTVLIMKQVNVTAKVVGALVSCKPIATPDYLKQLKEAVKQKTNVLPDPSKFLPPIVEKVIGQDATVFCVNEQRRTLFKEKTFIFLSQKQYKRLHTGIELAGGSTQLIKDDTDFVNNREMMVQPGTCVMQIEMADNTQAADVVVMKTTKLLKSKNLRMIAESELGLAVLYVSTKLYCNPSVSQAGVTLISCPRDSQAPGTTNQQVLALETQPMEGQYSQQLPKPGSNRNEISILGRVPSTPDQPKDSKPKDIKIKKEFISPLKPDDLFKETDENQPNITETKPPSTEQEVDRENGEGPSTKRLSNIDLKSSETSKRKRAPSPEFSVASRSADFTFSEDVRAKKIKTEPGMVEEDERGKTLDARTLSEDDVNSKERPEEGQATLKRSISIKAEPEDYSSQSQDIDDDGGSQMWRKNKKKKRRFLEEDTTASTDRKPQDFEELPQQSEPPIPANDAPHGFLCKANPPKSTIKPEPEDIELPSKLIVVREVSIVVRKPKPPKPAVVSGKPVKNFKKFKKAGYAGYSQLPRIIGGSDLVTHHNLPSQESQELFMPDIEDNNIDKADALADELFSMGSKQTKLPRGRMR